MISRCEELGAEDRRNASHGAGKSPLREDGRVAPPIASAWRLDARDVTPRGV